MRLGHAGGRDPHKARLAAHGLDVRAARVTHGRAQTAHKLMNDGRGRPLVGHAALDALGHQFLGALARILKIAIGGTLPGRHGAQRAHSPIGFIRATLVQLDFPRRLFRAGKQGAHHHRMRSRRHRFGQIAGKTHAAIGDHRHVAVLQRRHRLGDGAHLRHANAGHDARGANGARADADLNAIGAGLGQGAGGLGRGHIAADDLQIRVLRLEPAQVLQHIARVAVGGVEHEHVGAGIDQGRRPLRGIGRGAHGSAHAQTPEAVFTGIRVALRLVEILDGNHAAQREVLTDHEDFLDAVALQQALHLGGLGALAHRHQLVARGHNRRHRFVQLGFETPVAPGHDADQILARQHRHAGDAVGAGQFDKLGNAGILLDGDRVFHHTGLVLLDAPHLSGLLGDAHAFMNDADAALLRHGDGQAGFRHRVHGGGNQRQIQLDRPGEARAQRYAARHNLRITGQQQHIVEGQGFLFNSQHRVISRGRPGCATTSGVRIRPVHSTGREREPVK